MDINWKFSEMRNGNCLPPPPPVIWFLDRHDVKTKTIENSVCWQHLQKFKCIQKNITLLIHSTTSQYGKRTRKKYLIKKKKKVRTKNVPKLKKKNLLRNFELLFRRSTNRRNSNFHKNCKWNCVQRQSWFFPHHHHLCILWVNFQLDFFVSFTTREKQNMKTKWNKIVSFGHKKAWNLVLHAIYSEEVSQAMPSLICKHESHRRWVTDASLGEE